MPASVTVAGEFHIKALAFSSFEGNMQYYDIEKVNTANI